MPRKAQEPQVEETTPEEEPKTAFEQFIFHQRKALEETGKALEALLPEGFREHTGEAGKEFVKGFRVLIDAAIDELRNISEKAEDEDEGGEEKPSTTGKTKVKVQVD